MQEEGRPLLYANVHIFTLHSLDKFATLLYSSEQQWDSIRRIPYSTPGRWVQSIDVSEVRSSIPAAANTIDRLLTALFPLVPFVEDITLSREFPISRTAIGSLRHKDGVERLRVLKGLRISPPDPSLPLYGQVDPAVELVQSCPLLEQLEISNTVSILPEQQGNIDPDDLESPFPDVPSLNLTKLE